MIGVEGKSIRNAQGIWINSEYFREEAKHFEKYGYYCPDPKGTPQYRQYWIEQARRCREGYEVGGVRITGDHYNYLNFSRIKLTKQDNKREKVTRNFGNEGIGASASKKRVFPHFWDGDYAYYHCVDIARNGITLEEYNKLNLYEYKINDFKDGNFSGGKHVTVGKARRKGFSYKNGNIVANRYKQIPDSISIVAAHDWEYIYPEGTLAMVENYINEINENTAWARRKTIDRQDAKEDAYEIVIQGGVKLKKGFRSKVLGITCRENPDAVRGKDATLILLEEAGKFPNLIEVLNSTLPTLKDGIYTTGQILLFGTGGGKDSNWAAFEEIFYRRRFSKDFLSFQNVWDDGANDSSCSFFFPYWRNYVGFIDDQGNSLRSKAEAYEETIRKNIEEETIGGSELAAHKMEYPGKPKEAFNRGKNNIFKSPELDEHTNQVTNNPKYKNFLTPGEFIRGDGQIVFKTNYNLNPILHYPHRGSDDLTGCPVIFFPPYKVDGKIPDNLYVICLDPYAVNDAQDTTSLGSAYVIMQSNNIVPGDKGNRIVAMYNARPNLTDNYNKVLFDLADYYNAQIGQEQDRGDTVGYALRMKKIQRMAQEFELGFDESIRNQNLSTNRFGVKIGSGKKNPVKIAGNLYIRDWLYTPRGIDANGREVLNLHTIYDPGLLQELSAYDDDAEAKGQANFDRVSSFRVGMFHLNEMLYKQRVPQKPSKHEEALKAFFGLPMSMESNFAN